MIKTIKRIACILSLLCCLIPAYAAGHDPENQGTQSKGKGTLDFIENKGQWTDEVRYKANLPYGAIFLTSQGFVYNYASAADIMQAQKMHNNNEPDANIKIRRHTYKVSFLHAHKDTKFTPNEKRDYYHNYILGNDAAKWAGKAMLYGEIKQEHIYDGIDVVLYSKEGNLKYDFLVSPGSDPGQITLAFEGVIPEITREGHLAINTTVNKIIEEAPYAYQVIEGKTVTVKCRYKYVNNMLSFVLPEGYRKNYPLVIDPSVVFASYSGATDNVQGNACTTYDADGNFYIAGIAGMTGWPVTIGAFQTIGFTSDVVISKYNANGSNLIYATYYGGNGVLGLGRTLPQAMQVNAQQEIILAGSTTASDLPLTPGCFQNVLQSGGYNSSVGQDMFVTHFNSSGSGLLGATFIGGHHTEAQTCLGDADVIVPKIAPSEILLDSLGNIWVISTSVSTDFPTTANAIQPLPYNLSYTGDPRCVLFQLNGDCSQLLYGTYLSGSGSSAGWDIMFNHAGKLVICGSSGSYDFPITPGAVQSAFLGGSIFSYEHTDGFVAVIDPVSGALLHSTFLGTARRDHAFFVQVDAADNIYVLGRSLGNYPISAGVLSIPNGDIYIHKLNPDLTATLFSTRYGNPVSPGNAGQFVPTAFMVDGCNNLYITGYSAGNSLPVTNDAFEQNPRSFWVGVYNQAFSEQLFGSYFGAAMPDMEYIHYGGVNRSDPRGIIYQSASTTGKNFPATTNAYGQSSTTSGIDIVFFKLDLSTFGDKDTLITNNEIYACFKDSIRLRAVNPGFPDYTWNNGTHSEVSDIKKSGNYAVTYKKETGCGLFIDSFKVKIYPLPELNADKETCSDAKEGNASATTHTDNTENYTYTWYDASETILGTSMGNRGAAIQGLNPGHYTLRIQSDSGCDTTLPFTIEMLPAVNIEAGTDTIVTGKAKVQLWASGADHYTWQPAIWLNNDHVPDPVSIPEASVVYTVTGYNQYGCRASARVEIVMADRFFIPNAFSPNGDNLNDEFKIVNFGYDQLLEFKLFNRWGEKVFETINPETGWNGIYKNQPADAGTYYYYIRIAFQNGSVKTFKGDVTLIR